MTHEDVLRALSSVKDPELQRDVVDLGMVRDIVVDDRRIGATIVLTTAGCPLRNQIRADAEQALAAIAEGRTVEVKLDAMSCDERDALAGTPPRAPPARRSRSSAPARKTRTIAIASGKGGVGKCTVTVNLAVALAAQGHAVALIDADVYGPTVPLMMGLPAVPPETHEGKLIPPEAHGVKVVSMGFFLPDNEPVVWRGPMLGRAIEQFLGDVLWGSPDYLLIDLPPGTGDIALTIAQMIPGAELIIVTTPQEAAAKHRHQGRQDGADDQAARARGRREHGLLRLPRLRQPPPHLRPWRRLRDRPPDGHPPPRPHPARRGDPRGRRPRARRPPSIHRRRSARRSPTSPGSSSGEASEPADG